MKRDLWFHGWMTLAGAAALAGCALEAGGGQDAGSRERGRGQFLEAEKPALASLDRGAVDRATDHANSGEIVNGRAVSWKLGGWTAGPEGEQTTCNYGWCGIINIDDCSLEGEDNADGYGYGACNSSAWGERFAGYVWNGGENADYDLNASGTTTFGYHPYWCVRVGDEVRTYQGWSYEDSCAGSADYEVSGSGVTAIDLKQVGLGGTDGTSFRYAVEVPEEATDSAFEIFGGTGPVALFVKRGAEPTADDFDCRADRGTGVARCFGDAAGSYHLLVLGGGAFSDVSVRGSYRIPQRDAPVCGNGEVEEGEDCEQGACCTDGCTFVAADTTCRDAAGACDVAEACTGDAAACPADEREPDGTTCPDGTCVGGVCEPDDGGDPDPASCVDTRSCGGRAPAGCYCDSSCTWYGDCCADGPC